MSRYIKVKCLRNKEIFAELQLQIASNKLTYNNSKQS